MKNKLKVGDEVSCGINADCFYAGKITRITKRFIFTDSGKKYTRKVDHTGRVSYRQMGCSSMYLLAGRHAHLRVRDKS